MSCRPSPLAGRPIGTGIVHLGLGAFHRAHQAPFTEDAMASAGGDWGIEAVAMRSPAVARALDAQGGTYHLIERCPEGPRATAISAIRRTHVLAEAPEAVTARIADPAIGIVTLTVTEKAYGFDPATGDLDPSHPAIAADLAAPRRPRGAVGALVEGLRQRRAAGAPGLTAISCDNLPGNGPILSRLVRAYADRVAPDLARWIAAECRFPASMVDRITPAPDARTAELVRALCGRADAAAVETEPFRQWVIEDAFSGPRPAWEAAGALIVPDVAPFERMKLRMLNGAHSFIAAAGVVAGLPAVRDVMANQPLRRMARAIMDAAAETLEPLPDFNYDTYADDLEARFANPEIEHLCRQIATDSSQKLPQRQWAAAAERLGRGLPVGPHAFASAAWIRMLEGRDEQGAPVSINDPLAEPLARAAATPGPPEARVNAVAAVPGLGHGGLFDRPLWVRAVAEALGAIEGQGIIPAARAALAGSPD